MRSERPGRIFQFNKPTLQFKNIVYRNERPDHTVTCESSQVYQYTAKEIRKEERRRREAGLL